MYENKEEKILSNQEESEPEEEESGFDPHDQGEYFKSSRDRLTEKKINAFLIGTAMISIAVFSLAMALVYTKGIGNQNLAANAAKQTPTGTAASAQKQVIPSSGVTLPVNWGDIGIKLVQSGVINSEQFKALYANRGGMTPEMTQLLENTNNGNLKITSYNSGYILNLLWAFGLGQKSSVLDNGPMQDKRYGSPAQFASTAGWTVANGNVMNHYSKHDFVNLNDDQKASVERIAKNIYRPCCGNSTYFPDCNHGMAMLGLLELMASQGVSESDMYSAALTVNSYWFPDTYETIAQYMKLKGIDWSNVDAKAMLGEEYSSNGGFRNIQAAIVELQSQNQKSQSQTGSGGTAPSRPSGGCGV